MNYLMFIKVCAVMTLVILMILQSIIGTIGFVLIALVIFIFLFIRDRTVNNKTYTKDTKISINTTLDLIKNCTLDKDRKG